MKLNNIKNIINDNKSLIFTVGSIGLFVGALVLEHYADKKAFKKLDAKKEELGVEKLTFRETVETVGIDYIPTIGAAAIATTFGVVAHKIDMKDIAAAAGAYEFLKNRTQKQKEATEKVVGEEKAKEINSEMAASAVKERYPMGLSRKTLDSEVIRMYDPYLGQIIETTYAQMDDAFHKLSNMVKADRKVYLVDWWKLLVKLGIITYYPDRLGDSLMWEKDEIMDYLGLNEWEDLVVAEYLPFEVDGIPCMEISYISEPQ